MTPDPEAVLAAVLLALAEDPDNMDLVGLALQLRLVIFHHRMAALQRRRDELDAARRCN